MAVPLDGLDTPISGKSWRTSTCCRSPTTCCHLILNCRSPGTIRGGIPDPQTPPHVSPRAGLIAPYPELRMPQKALRCNREPQIPNPASPHPPDNLIPYP